jgi:ferredoxin--NADP+ reductase
MPDAIAAATVHLGKTARNYLSVIPVVTREVAPDALNARIGVLIRDGTLENRAGAVLNSAEARVMLCGNPDMIKEVRELLKERGIKSARDGVPGTLAKEGYW